MNEDEPFSGDRQHSTTGMLECLKMLAEEADNLPLPRTHLALLKAIRACEAERSRTNPLIRPRPRRNLVLH